MSEGTRHLPGPDERASYFPAMLREAAPLAVSRDFARRELARGLDTAELICAALKSRDRNRKAAREGDAKRAARVIQLAEALEKEIEGAISKPPGRRTYWDSFWVSWGSGYSIPSLSGVALPPVELGPLLNSGDQARARLAAVRDIREMAGFFRRIHKREGGRPAQTIVPNVALEAARTWSLISRKPLGDNRESFKAFADHFVCAVMGECAQVSDRVFREHVWPEYPPSGR